MIVTEPVCSFFPLLSLGAPIAKSVKPSLLKSPDVRTAPQWSYASFLSGTPGIFWWMRKEVSVVIPDGLPYKSVTAPASWNWPYFSPGAPIAKSLKPSLLKSPDVIAQPHLSFSSPASGIPLVSWSISCEPLVERPDDDPYKMDIFPTSFFPFLSFSGAATARSSYPSPLKSPTESMDPHRSPISFPPKLFDDP